MGSLNSWGPRSSTAGRLEDRLHGVQLVGPNGIGGWGRATHRRRQQEGGSKYGGGVGCVGLALGRDYYSRNKSHVKHQDLIF